MWSWMREGAALSLWWGDSGVWQAAEPGQAVRWDGLEAWCAAHPGARARLWLSAWWVLDMLIDGALPLHDDAAVLAYVRPLLQHYHGDAAAPWPLAAWQAGAARGVSALHGQPLAELQATAARHGVQLQAVQPWWARAMRLALAQEPSLLREPAAQLVMVEGRLVTRLDLRRGSLVGLQQRRLPQATPGALQAWLANEPVAVQRCLGYGLDVQAGASHPALPLLGGAAGRATLSGDHPPPAWWADTPRGGAHWVGRWAGRQAAAVPPPRA
ncbi:hypothetical protein [Aquabacterium sp. OR-4]|uniref:hypothetical protein n=1 Tax=Aquabacterium sp. OR-4 TaxID=2978127 RepID=UPI0028C8BF21|nr:hypothetical protein [Aquabacterium sp. OR-4]MDT7838951.1 hypothetical protein [Aquabacterium sp. OR-4]